jgi:glycosyltransferase involved in cell wall biosynthesis
MQNLSDIRVSQPDTVCSAYPSVSIIIPTYNEEEYIRESLNSLDMQEYPNIIEILVIDGMSKDRTKEIVCDFQKKSSKGILLIENPQQTQYRGVNIGIKQSRGEIIVNADAHAIYAPDYVSQCVKCLIETGAGSVGGPVMLFPNSTYVAKAIGFVHASIFGIGVAKFRRPTYEGYADTVWPGAFWRKIFDEIGLYKEDSILAGSDLEFNTRIRKNGYGIFITPKIKVYYIPRKTIYSFFKQCFRNGRDIITIALVLGISGMRPRHFVPLLFVIAVITLFFLSFFIPVAKYLYLLGLIVYGTALLLFSSHVAIRYGLQYILIMPFLFIILHLAYGCGSLWQLTRQIVNPNSGKRYNEKTSWR